MMSFGLTIVLITFMSLMNGMFKTPLDSLMIVFMDEISI